MNSISVAGQLGKDAEVRTIPSGEVVCSFSVADSQGRDKPTIWWNCQLWGKRAESLAPYLTKGQAVTVTGSVSEREWTDKDGQQRKSMEVRVQDVALQGGKREGAAPAPAPARAPTAPVKKMAPSGDFPDDDVPFADPLKRRAYTLAI